MRINTIQTFQPNNSPTRNQTGAGLSRQDSNPALRDSYVGFGAKKPKGFWDNFVDGAKKVGKRVWEALEDTEEERRRAEEKWNKMSAEEKAFERFKDSFMD